MNVKIISAILVLALASIACGFSIDLPKRPQAGPEIEESITVPDPKSDATRVSISFGAGKLAKVQCEVVMRLGRARGECDCPT